MPWDNSTFVADNGTSNPGLPASVIKILRGAVEAIAARGAKKLSMSDIIEASGVSRGTLYRYFAKKEDVLAAVTEFICVGFEKGIHEAGAGVEDPIERLRRVMLFYGKYARRYAPDRVFEVEPAFHLEFFRSRFGRFKTAVGEALAPTFDYLEQILGRKMDRDGFCEVLVRLQLSTLLVPAGKGFRDRWNASPGSIERWALEVARREA